LNLPVSSAMTDKLSELRQTINQLDDEILALVRRRMVLAADVIAAKNGGAAYRPGREAEVMDRLVAAAPDLPAQLVVNLWRQLMTASTALQNDSMTIAVHRDAMTVAGWHFGGFFTTLGCDDLDSMRQAMADGADIALMPAGSEAEMAGWLLDEPGLHVIARTPPVAGSTLVPVWMIGRQPADPVAEECTLVARHGTDGPELEVVAGRHDSAAGDGARVIGVIASNGKTD
jgi:chorismate mutase